MRAVGIVNYLPVEDENAFVDFEAEKPEPRGRDILVAVRAIAVNPVDVKVRAGRGAKNVVEGPPRIIGWDASGVVEAVGPDVTLFQPGSEVFYAGDITRPGSNAEYQVVDERIVGTLLVDSPSFQVPGVHVRLPELAGPHAEAHHRCPHHGAQRGDRRLRGPRPGQSPLRDPSLRWLVDTALMAFRRMGRAARRLSVGPVETSDIHCHRLVIARIDMPHAVLARAGLHEPLARVLDADGVPSPRWSDAARSRPEPAGAASGR